MPLPTPDYPRTPLHHRTIRAQSFEREDGLWDIDAELIDTKAYDFTRRSGEVHEAGRAVHHMHVRITFDEAFEIVTAQVVYDAAPYGKQCSCIAAAYGDLVGMNLVKGFRRAVKERFGRVAGCTHVSELAGFLPTVAIQSRAGSRARKPVQPTGRRPFQIDGCHALSQHGPIVREFHPDWYVPLTEESALTTKSDCS